MCCRHMFNIISATGPGFPGPVVYESGNRKPEEVRPQVVAGITDGDVNDLIDLIDSAGADKVFH